MRFGVISDTHGNNRIIRQAIAAAGLVDGWLHAGDYSQDARWLVELSGLPVYVVAGNCDGRVDILIDEYIEAGGNKIWLTHGHRYGVKHGLQDIVWWGGQYEADVAVFGHTHVPYCDWYDNMLLFNPGSLAAPRYGRPTFGLLTVECDGITGQIIEV